MNILKSNPWSRRKQGHQADIANPADYKKRKGSSRPPTEPGTPEDKPDAPAAEIPFPGRNELTPEQRSKGESSAGSALSAI
ncbi:MAG: hypothetical protein ABSH19_01085 [Opitutales bacterium]|jgi:hypothetical protein